MAYGPAPQEHNVCLNTLHYEQPWSYENYLKAGGYQAWRRILAEKMPRETVIDDGQAIGPARSRRRRLPDRAQVVVSCRAARRARSTSCATPTSPSPAPARTATSCATTRTRWSRASRSPCYATDSTVAYNYLRGEFHHEPFERFEQALEEAYAHGWLGRDIQGSGVDVDIHTALGAGAYICGEETALMESLEGKKGQPRFKPPFPANFGLYGKPTTINNTETFASVPAIIRNGAGVVPRPGQAQQRRPQDLLGLRPRGAGRATTRSASARRSRTCSNWPVACAAVASSRR